MTTKAMASTNRHADNNQPENPAQPGFFMPTYAPQFNAIAAATQRQQLDLQRLSGVRNSTSQLRAHLDKRFDHHRFDAIEFIGKPLNKAAGTEMLDDFLLMEAAEKFEPALDKTPLFAFILMRDKLTKRLQSAEPITLDDAKAVHRSADLARERLKRYTPRALAHGSIELNRIYVKRGDTIAYRMPKPANALMRQA
ncbi:MAG: hypothetical protein RR800_00405 [Comamonas sp.]